MTHDERRMAAINSAINLTHRGLTAEGNDTGGGCTAAVIHGLRTPVRPDKTLKIMITAEGGMYIPDEGDDTLVGIYDADDCEDEGRVILVKGPANWAVGISEAVENLLTTK